MNNDNNTEWIKSIDTRLQNLNSKMNKFYYVLFGIIIVLIVTNTSNVTNVLLLIKAFVGL